MRKISLRKKDKSINPKIQKILIICAIFIVVLGVAVFLFLQNYHINEVKVVKPTCESDGYTETACSICKKIDRTHYTRALGHNWGEVKVRYAPKQIEFGENYHQCSRCKKEKSIKTEPTIDFKKLYFSGDAFTVNSNIEASGLMEYSYKGKKSTYFVTLAYTDEDRTRYSKHDYIISFFADKRKEKPVEVALMNGKKAAHSWRMIGNYYDFKNVRDIVVSDIFKEVRATRKSFVDNRMKSNFLTTIQEPILFFVNTSFSGVFRICQVESEHILNVKKTDKNCAIVSASYSSYQSFFKSRIDPSGPWKIKYNSNGEEDFKWIYDSLNELSNFIVEKDGKAFKKGISKHLDVEAMIDYMLVIYTSAAADNVGKNLTLATYDGKVWIPTFYNAKASYGLNNDGEITLLETILAPEYKEINGELTIIPDTNSLLFEKMLVNFYPEIKARYNALKDKVFTADNIFAKMQKHTNSIPALVYEAEAKKYALVDSKTNMKVFLKDFMKIRKNNLEEFFKGVDTKKPTKPKETTN